MREASRGRQAIALELSDAERTALSRLAGRRNTAQVLAQRARIVLACAEGVQHKDVAVRLDLDAATVAKWRRRFAAHRLDGLRHEPRSDAPRTPESQPPDATH